MSIKYRSPKNLTEEMLNEALGSASNMNEGEEKYEAMHMVNAWFKLADAKEVHKIIVRTMVDHSPASIQGLIIYCLMAGFNLHATYGDQGAAKAYIGEEKKNEAIRLAEQQKMEAEQQSRFRSVLGISDQVIPTKGEA